MIIRDGQKWACRSCITGHRSSKCVHEDRELFPVAKKGRPSSQCKVCTHGRTSTPQSPAVHDAQCTCQAKRRGKTGSKSPLDTPLATASSVAPPVPDNLVALHDGSKRQRYSHDSAMYNSDGSPAFPPPGWPSSSSYGSMDSMQSYSSASSATSSPQSSYAAVMPNGNVYSFPDQQHIPWLREHGTPLPVQPPDQHQQQQPMETHNMRFQSLQEPQRNYEQWPVSYAHGHSIPPPSSPGAAGESPSTALYRAMGLQGLPEQYQHALSNPSPLLIGQPQDQDEYHRPLWLGHDVQSQMRSPDSYHQHTYSQNYQQDAVPAHSTSFYNGMASGSDVDPSYESNRFIPSDLRGDSPSWNASTPSAAIKDSWMQQLPMPEMQRPGYPDGPVRWKTAPPNMYSAAYNHGDKDQQRASYSNEEQQQQQREFPEPPPLTRAAASMPAPATHDSSQFFHQVTLPQVMSLRLPEPRKRKSVDS